MALKQIPTQGDSNWGTPLNNHIAQLQSPVDGSINKFEQFSQRPTTLTADDVGKTYLYTQTGNIHMWTGTAWKVLNESVINVKDYGAVGDGVTDDTVAINLAINQSISDVCIPDGVYAINVNYLSGNSILAKNNLNLKLSVNCILRAIPTTQSEHAVILINDKVNVLITGGSIEGDRYSSSTKTGEWGMGIMVTKSKKITIENIKVSKCWGDGIYVGSNSLENLTTLNCENIFIDKVICDDNRRQGISVVACSKIKISNSSFTNTTNGTLPMAGIDLEPNNIAGTSVDNVLIEGNHFFNNNYGVLMISLANAKTYNVIIINNKFKKNNNGIFCDGDLDIVKLSNNIIENSVVNGIKFIGNNSTISNNSINGIDSDNCIYVVTSKYLNISNNNIYNAKYENMVIEYSEDCNIANNILGNNSLILNGAYPNIVIRNISGIPTLRNTIQNNIFRSGFAPNTASSFAIKIEANVNDTKVIHNDFDYTGRTGGTILDTGINTLIKLL